MRVKKPWVSDQITWAQVLICVVLVIFVWVLDFLLPDIRTTIVLVGIACLFITNGRNVRIDKALTYLVFATGLAPVLGWIPELSRIIDPILVLATLSIAGTLNSLRSRHVSADWSIFAVMVAILLGVKRWWSFTSGTSSEVFARLFSGWDHFGHFYLFLNSIRFNSFVFSAPALIPGMTSYDRHYPAGIQMNWAQWWPQDIGLAENHPVDLLPQYVAVVILTAAVSALLISISIIRLFNNLRTQIIIGISVALSVYLLVFAGPLSITIWNGFPNFLIAISGVVVVASVLYRPLNTRGLQLAVLFAGVCITTYNWYPLLVPVGLAIGTYLVKNARELHGGSRWAYLGSAFALAVIAALPIFGTFAFGVTHLTVDGGITQLPPNIIVFVLGISFAIGVYDLLHQTTHQISPVISPLLLAPAFQVVVTTYVRLSEQSYPYYVQKIAIGMVIVCLTVLLMRFAEKISAVIQALALERTLNWVPLTILALAASFSVSQIFGYIGPDWKILAPTSTSSGLYAPQSVEASIPARLRTTNILISMSNQILAAGPQKRDCFVFSDIDMQDYDPVLTNYWVGVLTWTLTEEHLVQSQGLIPLKTGITDVPKNAGVLETLLSPEKDCPIVSRKLAVELTKRDAKWADVLWVIEDDGHVSKFRE